MIYENIAKNILAKKIDEKYLAAFIRNEVYDYQSQIVMRDSFAKAALTGLLNKSNNDYDNDAIAQLSYSLADAMLKARKETK